MYTGYSQTQTEYAIVCENLEHTQILVTTWDPRASPLQMLWDNEGNVCLLFIQQIFTDSNHILHLVDNHGRYKTSWHL